jgi:hypothetical protein
MFGTDEKRREEQNCQADTYERQEFKISYNISATHLGNFPI